MATIHDKYVVELAEVIKGYGNPPDVNDPFCLSEFYRFYEIPNVCVSAENFKKMRPLSDFTEENEARVEKAISCAESYVRTMPSAQPEQPPEIQDILNYLDTVLHPIVSPEHWDVYAELHDMISTLPSAEPEIIRCKDCKWKQGSECVRFADVRPFPDDFCSRAERRTDEGSD